MNDNSKSTNKTPGEGASQEPHRLSDEKPNEMPNDMMEDTAIAADPVAEAKQEAEKFRNEFLYLRAEFENYKKNAIKERSDIVRYGSKRLVTDLLNVLDIFESALATEVTAENFQNFRKGIEMTASELKNVLQRNGVTEVQAKGQPFDPSVHEALSSEESDAAPGTITQVFKKPYKLHDMVVRPGQVVVAKAKSQ